MLISIRENPNGLRGRVVGRFAPDLKRQSHYRETAPPQPSSYRCTAAPVSGVGGLGTLSRTFPFEVGSLDFVTRADKRRGQNRASDNPPRERQNELFFRIQTVFVPLWVYIDELTR